jgi:hypothetical protein
MSPIWLRPRDGRGQRLPDEMRPLNGIRVVNFILPRQPSEVSLER